MAVSATKYDSDLVIKVRTGTDPGTGEPFVRLRRYTRVKPEATHEAVYTVGQAIAGLQVTRRWTSPARTTCGWSRFSGDRGCFI
jgi:hypothetical protein